jgi:hypothetical protein
MAGVAQSSGWDQMMFLTDGAQWNAVLSDGRIVSSTLKPILTLAGRSTGTDAADGSD